MDAAKNIYLIGICGTGVGALAGLLKRLGHHVRGSDENVYPPMSDKLREWGIEIHEGFDAANLQREPKPDLVVVGNVIRRHNPEAVYAREHRLTTLSMPQAVAELGIGARHSIVFAGTHGKTTTTALCAHVLVEAGADPSFLVGGALVGYTDSFRVGNGDHFVIEGDEYDTAYFDKGPKFLHYRPKTAVITSLEFDHADIFKDITAIETAFAGLIDKVPNDASGHLVVWHGATRARKLVDARADKRRVTVYASERHDDASLWCASHSCGPAGSVFEPVLRGEPLGEMRVPLWGEFSVNNALAVIAALSGVGISPDAIRRGFATFAGIRRRMEVRGEPRGITVVDDFAHHPTAVRETLKAVRERWPGQPIWALFEPRSATNRRNVHHVEMVDAFGNADRVVIGSHHRLAEVPEAERFDPARLAADLDAAGTEAIAIAEPRAIADYVRDHARPGDVIMVLSNGDFGGLHPMLLDELEKSKWS